MGKFKSTNTLALLLLVQNAGAQNFSPEFQNFRNQQNQRQIQNQQLAQDQQLENQIKIENICNRTEVQNVLLNTFNNTDLLIKDRGKITSLKKMTTERVMVRAGLLSCNGKYHFSNGKSEKMTFTFPYTIHSY